MEDLLEQAKQYRIDAMYSGQAHYRAATIASQWHTWLGLPVVVTTSIVATSIFATINAIPSTGWKIAAGVVSLLAAVLSALQTFFNFSEMPEKHKLAGASYGELRRELEVFLLRYADGKSADRSAAIETLNDILSRFSDLATKSPSVPDRAFRAAVRLIQEQHDKLPTSIGTPQGGE